MRIDLISDRELIRRYLANNETALVALIDRHRERLFSYIMMLVRDRQLAEDVFQDTFIRVVNSLKRKTYNDQGKFVAWIMRIAHNLVVDHYRREKRMPKVDGGEDFDIFDIIRHPDPNVDEDMVREQIHSELGDLIELLPEKQKTVLKMRYYGRMSFNEIAEETNVSINTALGRMRYALKHLRKAIEEKQMQLRT